MAWNEPGGSNDDKDPWGGGGGRDRDRDRQGPPDLDEAFTKLLDGLGVSRKRSRSGGSGGGGSVGGGAAGAGFIGLVLAGLAAFWLYNAVYVVDEQEQAVILRLGKYHETVGPGLNIYFPPFERKYQENVTRVRAYSKQGQMLTEDENIIEVPLTVQYRISSLKDFVLNVDQPEVSLQHATESALRHVAGSTSMDQVLTEGRVQMAVEVKERLQGFLDNYGTGITVAQVNIQGASAPREVQEAFDDVIRAREDEQRARNQAEAYANGVVPEARGQAQRILEEANGYRDEVVARATGEADRFSRLLTEYRKAPEVTRERLYLETMQTVLGNTSKVLMSGDKGQNSLVYLPLDRMIDAAGSGGSANRSSAPSMKTTEPAPVTRIEDQPMRLPVQSDRSVRTRESR